MMESEDQPININKGFSITVLQLGVHERFGKYAVTTAIRIYHWIAAVQNS